MPDTILSKYGDERSAYWYWWFDEDSAADLADAVRTKISLPPKKLLIYFNEIFGRNP